MSVTETDKVDIVATRPGSSSVLLVVTDHLRWDDLEGHLAALRAKLDTYVAFVESGQLHRLEEPPLPPNPEVRIRVAMRHAPPPAARAFFEESRARLAGIGVGLDQTVDSSPDGALPRAPRLVNALGLGLGSALLTAGAVLGAMLLLGPSEPGEDFAGMFALLFAPPAQLISGTWGTWSALGDASPRPRRAWAMSTGIGYALTLLLLLTLGPGWALGSWRTHGLALLGLALGGAVPTLVPRIQEQDATHQGAE